MLFPLLAVTLTQLLALGNASPQQLLEDNQLCHEADGRISDTRWAELFGILGIVSSQPGAISAYTFVINEYDGHYLVRQNGCYQTVTEASDLMNQEVRALITNIRCCRRFVTIVLFPYYTKEYKAGDKHAWYNIVILIYELP